MPRIVFYLLVTGIAAVVTYLLSVVIWKLSTRYRLYPKIRERDVHTRPTPRLGGVAMFLGMVLAFAIASQIPQLSLVFAEPGKVIGLLVAALIIVLIGVADDIWDLDWWTKLAGQVIAAGVLAWQGVQMSTLPLGGITIVSPYISLGITVLAVVLVMNAINFIDGLDGLVAGVALIANGVFFVCTYWLQLDAQTEYFNLASLISAVLIGACLGFLPVNFHPAKLFMGDAGALLVGLLMAASAISVTGQVDAGGVAGPDKFSAYFLAAYIPILLPFAVLVVPLLDFGLAMVRRLRAGKSPFSADREHLHHRLLDMGHSHLQAVLIFYGWTLVVSVGVLAYMFVPFTIATLFIVVGLIVCAIVTLAPLSRRKAGEAVAQSAGAGIKSASVVRRALFFGGIVTLAIAVVGSIVGYLVSGPGGLASGLIGAGSTALFMGATALSIVVATAATENRPGSMLYFGIVAAMWMVKFVVFIALLLLVRGQPWVSPYVFFFSMIAAVIGSLAADAVALLGARVPYVGDLDLPGSTPSRAASTAGPKNRDS